MSETNPLRIAAVSDIHYTKSSKGALQDLFVEAYHSLRLEKVLNRLTMKRRVVLLHYSPIRDTVKGEHPELFPFLGSSRFEATIDQFEVSAVFHGHARHGTPEG